jgi:N-acetylglutamate synthase-like GNAT family acetyltransferase
MTRCMIVQMIEGTTLRVIFVSCSHFSYISSSNIGAERSSLIVDPNYQKLGLGRRLVEHDNEMADQAGAKTWVSASANSKHLFESLGFVQLAEESVDLGEKNEDGEERVGRVWLFLRELRAKGS